MCNPSMRNDAMWTRCQQQGWHRVALIGITKHAGKTTALNNLVTSATEAKSTLGLCSIGLDGERLDSLLGVAKPAIFAPAGTVVASAEQALEQSGVQVEWLEQLNIDSPLGPVMLARLTAPGQVYLAGVRQRQHVERIVPRLQAYGAQFCLVDGAFDRIAAAAPYLVDAAVLAVGATAGKTVAQVVHAATPLLRRFQLPEVGPTWREKLHPARLERQIGAWVDGELRYSSPHQAVLGLRAGGFGASGAQVTGLYLPGALSDGLAQQLADWPAPLEIVVDHPAQVLAGDSALRTLSRRGHHLSVWRALPLAGLAVNPHSILGYQLPWLDLAQALSAVVPGLLIYNAVTGQILAEGEGGDGD